VVRHARRVVAAGPRVHPSLVEEIVRLDDGKRPIAEICRGVGAFAERRGLTRPSYEAVRELVHFARFVRANRGPSLLSEISRDLAARSAYWFALDAVVRSLAGSD
jgi:hypothetical protein